MRLSLDYYKEIDKVCKELSGDKPPKPAKPGRQTRSRNEKAKAAGTSSSVSPRLRLTLQNEPLNETRQATDVIVIEDDPPSDVQMLPSKPAEKGGEGDDV